MVHLLLLLLVGMFGLMGEPWYLCGLAIERLRIGVMVVFQDDSGLKAGFFGIWIL